MASVKKELQGAIVQRLKTDPAVTALVNGRIYDSVPGNAAFPYISYGPADFVRADAECLKAFSGSVQLDVWSRAVGYPESLTIADAVERALDDANLALPTNALVFIDHVQSTAERDPDGLTSRVRMHFETVIEQR